MSDIEKYDDFEYVNDNDNEIQRPKLESKARRIGKFIFKVIISSFAVVITSYLMPGVYVESYITAIIVALVLAFLNTILKPILIILTIPVTVFSLGLFLLVINAFIIQVTAYFVDGFEVNGFWAALFFSIILSLITWVLELPARRRR
ncbi:MAG: phage holin family protein [Bacteroidetes bacterium]|nr:phage holin family protein [Bacteroidota bacterium]